MTYSDDYNLRTSNVKFNDVADAIDDVLTRNVGGTTTGTANTYIATPSPAWTSYVTSSFIIIIPHVDNTSSSTVNVSGLGAKTIKRGGSNIGAGVLKAGFPTLLVYDGVNFEILLIQNALTADGTTNPTANLAMNGFRHTGVGNAAARTDYAAAGQVQDGSFIWLGTTGGTATAQTASATPALTAYAAGQKFRMKIGSGLGSTGTTATSHTININSLGAKSIKDQAGEDPRANSWIASSILELVYDGTNFIIANTANALWPLSIDSSNDRVGIKTTAPEQELDVNTTGGLPAQLTRFSNDTTGAGVICQKSRATSIGTNTIVSDGDFVGYIQFKGADGTTYIAAADVVAFIDGTPGTSDMPGELHLRTTPAGGSTPVERVIIRANGTTSFNTADTDPATNNVGGVSISGASASLGYLSVSRMGGTPLRVNRGTNDGNLLEWYQAGTLEGAVSVSGNTITYGAFSGSHWAQLSNNARPDILRGTVLETVNELCSWQGEQNERLAKVKVSDVAGSSNVYGVFMSWDDEWTETNDMRVTSLGAFICRLHNEATPQPGDLLESNGDGTARVQSDNLIKSSTIGKVTCSIPTHTYSDGTFCVPVVLMCG